MQVEIHAQHRIYRHQCLVRTTSGLNRTRGQKFTSSLHAGFITVLRSMQSRWKSSPHPLGASIKIKILSMQQILQHRQILDCKLNYCKLNYCMLNYCELVPPPPNIARLHLPRTLARVSMTSTLGRVSVTSTLARVSMTRFLSFVLLAAMEQS